MTGEWLDALASDEPAPGGGAAAAMTAATGAALAAMAARRSGDHLSDADAVVAHADRLRAGACHLADEDAAAYRHLLEVLRAARRDATTPDEVVGAAFEGVTEVPLQVAEVAVEVAELCVRIAVDGNPNLRGDVVTGALLGQAAARAAVVLVEMNVARGGLATDHADRARALADRATATTADLAAEVGAS